MQNAFLGKDHINVVFLGGSITQGAGASKVENCYANRTGEWLKSVYGEENVTYYNKGVGGTPSEYGLLRLERDVISKNPDLVFIEFAVNDGGKDTRHYMESIVRSLKHATDPYIVFLYTTDAEYTTVTKFHEEVADFYGIPQISLKDALKKELGGKNAMDAGYLTDEVHPSDKGYDVYFREIVRCLTSGEYLKKPEAKGKLTEDSSAVQTEFISAASARVERIGAWETNTENPERSWAKTESVGDRLKLSFEGDIFALEHGLHADSAMYEIWIDGALVGTKHPVYREIRSYQLVQGYADFHLGDGMHEVEIVTIPDTTGTSGGTQVLIYNFIVGKKM